MKKFIILISMLLLIALPAGAMAACAGSCVKAAPSQSCETACPMGNLDCNAQTTCADQALCPAGGQGCGVAGCAESPGCVAAGCSDGTSCEQMQACGTNSPGEFARYYGDFVRFYLPVVPSRSGLFSQFTMY